MKRIFEFFNKTKIAIFLYEQFRKEMKFILDREECNFACCKFGARLLQDNFSSLFTRAMPKFQDCHK